MDSEQNKNVDVITLDVQPFLMPGSILLSAIIFSLAFIIAIGNLAASLKGLNLNTSTNGNVTATTTPTQADTSLNTIETASSQLGLDIGKIKQCISDATYQSIIDSDIAEAGKININGTPGFVVGISDGNNVTGLRIPGAFPYSTFQDVLNAYSQNDTAKIDELDKTIATQADIKTSLKVTTPIGKSVVMGNKGSNLAIVEFTDLDCYYCQRHHKEVFPSIKKDLIDTNKIAYVVKNSPIVNLHPDANNKALASECVRNIYNDETYIKFIDLFLSN